MGNKLSSKRKSSPSSRSNTPVGSSSTSSNTTGTMNSSKLRAYDEGTISSLSSTKRRMHQVANSTYWFPSHDEEMDRLIGVCILEE